MKNFQRLLFSLLLATLAISANAQQPGFNYWYRADGQVDTTATGRVTSWANSGSIINPLQQVNDANRPRYIRNAINGRPAIEFDGNDILATTAAIPLASYTVFTVFNSTNSSLGLVYEHSANANTNSGSFLSTSDNSTVQVRRSVQNVLLNHTMNWAHDGQYRIVTHVSHWISSNFISY